MPNDSDIYFGDYSPTYLNEIYRARGSHGQIFLYYALLADLKPALDDWIYVDKLDEFISACEKYSLVVETESVFYDEGWSYDVRSAIGSEMLTTTIAQGAPVDAGYYGRVHLYVSKSGETLDRIKRTGWYPVCVNNRIVTKPIIDYYWFGEHLGYPKCCIDFFAKFNNHNAYRNTLMKPFENTKTKPNYLCNSLVKDSFCYLYHIPCSFDCTATAELSAKLRAFIQQYDPTYVEIIDRHLKLNFLVFRERDIYAFDGRPEGNILKYNNGGFVDKYLYPGILEDIFRQGDTLEILDDRIFVHAGDRMIKMILKTETEPWFFISFADD